jgi:hypothetical protein
MILIAVPFTAISVSPLVSNPAAVLFPVTATADARIALSLAMNDCHHIKRHNIFNDLATITEEESTITKVTQKFRQFRRIKHSDSSKKIKSLMTRSGSRPSHSHVAAASGTVTLHPSQLEAGTSLSNMIDWECHGESEC